MHTILLVLLTVKMSSNANANMFWKRRDWRDEKAHLENISKVIPANS
jgi:hypothetical protein